MNIDKISRFYSVKNLKQKSILNLLHHLVLIITLNSSHSFSQEDSANFYFKSKLPPFQKIKKCMDAAFVTQNQETFVKYYNKLTAIPEIGKNPEYVVYATNILSYNIGELGKLTESTSILEEIMNKNKGLISDTLSSKCYNYLAYLYFSIGDYELAVNTCFTAIKFAEKTKNNNLKGSAYNNLGLILSEKPAPDFKKAYDYFIKAEKLLLPYKNPTTLGLVYLRLGDVLSMQDKYSNAEIYFTKALRISDSCNKTSIQKWTLEKYGKMLKRIGNINKALSLLKRSLELSEKNNDYIGQASTSYELASLYIMVADYKNASQCVDSAISVSKRTGQLNTLYMADKIKSEICERNGDIKNALYYFKQHKILYDSISKNESIKNINELEQKYKTQEQEKKLLEKEKLLVEQQADINKQQTIRYYFLAGFIALCAILLLLFRGYTAKKRTASLLKEKNYQIEEKNNEILSSISYAKRIQRAILPSQRIIQKHLPESFVLYKPKDIVAGDFYWMENFDFRSKSTKDYILIAAADCTGHGVPGAMVSVVCHNALNRSVREYELNEPGEILDKARELIIEEFEKSEEDVSDGMDISIISLSIKKDTLKWAGANNPLWIIRNKENEIEEFKPNKQPIGKYIDIQPFTTHTVKLNSGDCIYIFTDGFQDQFGGEKGKKFMAGKIKKLLLKIKNEPMERQKHLLEKTFEDWKGTLEQVDDVTFIGIRV